ncbi:MULTISPECIES: hypothetical protein [unclassified Leptolyngbya]|uniref:hypothetical protein n=1 Tax=unclassified Leptolyngbya TaxID=2650499 RepID=UPI0016856169|nr:MULTISPECIES: hypothetical protein [unclassified Leptolyngbya]MBD1909547.1 hypothetical protein [Leptolyngbya sp. FACHB-8]MBD2154085.1 hypothetical protein [Leptolyngbya sp. FACHB-16]
MKRLSLYLVSSLAVVLYPNLARGDDLTTAFQLPPVPTPQPSPSARETAGSLPIPPTAAEAPIQGIVPQKPLPPPPPRPEAEAPTITATESTAPPISHNEASSPPEPPPTDPNVVKPVELSFGLEEGGPTVAVASIAAPAPGAAIVQGSNSDPLEPLFEGGANSLVARVVGSAEGTRTAEGQRTPAFYGHRDPGNGVWNLGSFSYQHGAASPEEADEKQLKRLRKQAATLQEKAVRAGIDMSLAEQLNGIDLANQSPRAALHRGGYIDRLAESRQFQMQGDEAILWSRTRAFLDPDTQKWNAPGLGNTAHGVTRDQERRMRAIARALNTYQQQVTAQANTSSSPYNPSSEELATLRLLSFDISH